MTDNIPEEWVTGITETRDCVARAIEFLISEDTFGAVLQLQKVRYLLNSLSEDLPVETRNVVHDWAIVDPYTAQCRTCGRQRPIRVEERMLMPL